MTKMGTSSGSPNWSDELCAGSALVRTQLIRLIALVIVAEACFVAAIVYLNQISAWWSNDSLIILTSDGGVVAIFLFFQTRSGLRPKIRKVLSATVDNVLSGAPLDEGDRQNIEGKLYATVNSIMSNPGNSFRWAFHARRYLPPNHPITAAAKQLSDTWATYYRGLAFHTQRTGSR